MSEQDYTRRSFLKAIGMGAARLAIPGHKNARLPRPNLSPGQ